MSLSRDEATLPRLLNKKQVLALVPVTFPTLWKWIRRGEFPAPRTIGNRPMWLETEILDWITSRPTRSYKS
jgi:predicted DNA-binding transcriptional regulator AlpA